MAQELYIRVKLGLRGGDGAAILARRLEDPRAHSYVPDLWDWFARLHPEGEVVGPDAAYLIAAGSGWLGDADKFCAAMVAAGFLAHIPEGYRVKGWREWAGFHFEARAKATAKKAAQRKAKAESLSRPQDVPRTSTSQTREKTASEGSCPGDPSLISSVSDLASQGGAGGTPPLLHSDSPVAAVLPCVGSLKTYGVTLSQVTEWQHAYPGVDVLAEVERARVWLEANPSRRKTHGGMARFLVAWLGRAQDSPRRAAPKRPDNGRPDPEAMDYSKPPPL